MLGLERYLIIESKQPIQTDEQPIISMFESLLTIKEIKKDTHHMVIYYQHETDISFEDIILNMMSDTLSDLRIYVSHHFDDLVELESHLQFTMHKLSQINFNKYVYLNDQIILKSLLHQIDPSFKKHILRKFTSDQSMMDTIKTYLECNQNMSEAAKELYVHRNTLIQRMDKFYQVTGFDVRKFNDAFLIYHLIK